jgi:hypothetical protein
LLDPGTFGRQIKITNHSLIRSYHSQAVEKRVEDLNGLIAHCLIKILVVVDGGGKREKQTRFGVVDCAR